MKFRCNRPLQSRVVATIQDRLLLSAKPLLRRNGSHDYRPSLLPSLFATDDDDSTDGISSESENENEPLSSTEEEDVVIIPSPPRFLALGYNMAAFLNILAAAVLIWNTGRINNVAITITSSSSLEAAKFMQSTRHQVNILPTYVAGSLGHLILVAGSCNILSGSVRKNRLATSDTSKRLTMGTLIFGFLGLFSLPGEAGCITYSTTMFGAAFVMTQLAKFVTAFVSFLGWEHGAGGFGSSAIERIKNILREVVMGCKGVWKTLPVSDERPASFYRTLFIFMTLGNAMFNLPDLVFNLQQGGFVAGLFSLPVSLTISSVARLGLLSALLYILKDASEWKRLEETTFVQLNMMVGLWAIGVGIAQGLIDFPTMPFNIRRAADKILFGLIFLNNGVVSQLSKMGIIKKRYDMDPDADPPLRVLF